jgi:hypothetical protein
MTDRRTAKEIADYYEEIRTAHRTAEENHQSAIRHYHMAVLDNMKAQAAGGFPDPRPEQHYQEQARLLLQWIRKYYSMLPCDAFAERFGWVFHELYKAKYPIYAATKVQDMPYLPSGYLAWTYVVPEALNMLFYGPDSPPPIITTRQYTVPIELWAETGTSRRVRLAYANEIDTVLVFPSGG